jgi:hypothetical protein
MGRNAFAACARSSGADGLRRYVECQHAPPSRRSQQCLETPAQSQRRRTSSPQGRCIHGSFPKDPKTCDPPSRCAGKPGIRHQSQTMRSSGRPGSGDTSSPGAMPSSVRVFSLKVYRLMLTLGAGECCCHDGISRPRTVRLMVVMRETCRETSNAISDSCRSCRRIPGPSIPQAG